MKVTDVRLWTALVTPFTPDDAVDMDAFGKLIDHQLSGGVKGLLLYGSTGEAATLNLDEKEALARYVQDNKKDAKVMMGVTHNVTSLAVENAKRCCDWGADVLMAAAPYYNKPSDEGMLAHFTAIHDATDLPLVLYNIPGRVAVDMSESLIRQLAQLPRVVGLKEASANLMMAHRLQNELTVWSGDDPLILPYMSLGAVGGISVNANLFPAEFSALVEAQAAGEIEKARNLADRFAPWYPVVFSESNPMGIKMGLHAAGFIENRLRLPLVAMKGENAGKIKEALGQLSCAKEGTNL